VRDRRAIRILLACAFASAGLLAVPTLAGASTANAVAGGPELVYQAAPGEVNIMGIRREGVTDESAPDSAATRLEVSDAPGSVLITPQGDCRAPNGTMTPNYRVFCPVVGSLRIDLGDGSDQIAGHTASIPWLVDGGSGGDAIETGSGNDNLVGGADNDTLIGDEGNDTMLGQQGRDVFSDRDGDNRMVGGGSNDVLNEGVGNSTVTGGGGRDIGGDEGGADRISLGGGDDRFHADDGDAERSINCGPGRRDKVYVDSRDPTPSGCERVID
jgi:Ca2+-binding RTX toxin-like protein